jgi:hypothetical protein
MHSNNRLNVQYSLVIIIEPILVCTYLYVEVFTAHYFEIWDSSSSVFSFSNTILYS